MKLKYLSVITDWLGGRQKILVWFRRKIRNNFVYQRNAYSQEIKKNKNTGGEQRASGYILTFYALKYKIYELNMLEY